MRSYGGSARRFGMGFARAISKHSGARKGSETHTRCVKHAYLLTCTGKKVADLCYA